MTLAPNSIRYTERVFEMTITVFYAPICFTICCGFGGEGGGDAGGGEDTDGEREGRRREERSRLRSLFCNP